MKDHKDLIVWQKSMELTRIIYTLTKRFPQGEIFGLTNQIRRAVVSIPSNIAEGFGRNSDKQFIHFLKIAKGSAAELETQLLISRDLSYLTAKDAKSTLALYDEIARMLGALIRNIEKRVEKRQGEEREAREEKIDLRIEESR